MQFTTYEAKFKMNVEANGYFDKDTLDKKFLQKLVLYEFIQNGIDHGLSRQEIRDTLTEEMYHKEGLEDYEAAALLRDAIKIYDIEFANQ